MALLGEETALVPIAAGKRRRVGGVVGVILALALIVGVTVGTLATQSTVATWTNLSGAPEEKCRGKCSKDADCGGQTGSCASFSVCRQSTNPAEPELFFCCDPEDPLLPCYEPEDPRLPPYEPYPPKP